MYLVEEINRIAITYVRANTSAYLYFCGGNLEDKKLEIFRSDIQILNCNVYCSRTRVTMANRRVSRRIIRIFWLNSYALQDEIYVLR